MDKAIHEATEETVHDEPLLSEILKHFTKEATKLTTMAEDKFQNDKKAEKKDAATNAMLQFSRSISAKQVAAVATNPYANAVSALFCDYLRLCQARIWCA